MKLSKYQEDIITWVNEGKGNAIINSTAGSAKSFTLLEIAKQPSVSNGILLAYNTHIAKHLNEKIGRRDFEAKTNHSLGRGLLVSVLGNKLTLNAEKYKALCKEDVEDWLGPAVVERYKERNKNRKSGVLKDHEINYRVLAILCKAVSLTQNTLGGYSTEDIVNLDEHFTFTDTKLDIKYSEIAKVVNRVINEGINQAKRINLISYEDMLYLPYIWDIKSTKYDWVLLDELQDFSPVQFDLVKRLTGSNTRVVGCGDNFQSINSYIGSKTDFMQTISKELNAVNLPLSITYRLPPNHVKLVTSICPHVEMEAFKTEDGKLEVITLEEFIKTLRPGDGVLARRTKDLVQVCLKTIGGGKKATVKGKDIGKGLVNLIGKVCKDDTKSLDGLGELLEAYFIKEAEKLKERSKIEALRDKIDSIYSCISFYASSCVQDLCWSIEGLFTDKEEGIVFKSCHSQKGLEHERVFIINYFDMPLHWVPEDSWEYQQELNCRFVALTRSSKDMFFVAQDATEYQYLQTYIESHLLN